MKKLSWVFAVLAVVAVVAAGGCKPKKNEVEISGVATMDGTPIDLGIVQFSNGTAEGGGNIQDGKYTANVPRGELTVRVRGYRYTGPEPEIPEIKPGDAPAPPPQRPRELLTPEDLWQNPTLKISVEKAGTYDLELKAE